MTKAKVSVVKDDNIDSISKNLFGSFIEHLGRAVYGGIYEPSHSTADSDGFRGDVLEVIKDMNVPVVRYPGGNFVSSYFWEDGVGPRESRKKKLEPAWRSVETNQFGTDEFIKWCDKAGTKPMLAVNLGTRGIQDAINYLEYCNVPGGTYYSDLRIKNGAKEPHNIKYWCLGNEMDGRWQTGYKSPIEYALLAAKTGKAMKTIDPDIELIVCGSTNTSMKTYPEWEVTLLDHAYHVADYVSAHIYLGDFTKNINDYMASAYSMENSIKSILSVCDYAKIKNKQEKDMMISFDEWGVWYHSVEKDKLSKPWTFAPSLLEENYNFADALATGAMVISLIRHADRVKVGCLAQLVNVIAPIMTETGGGFFRQTTYYPYEHALKYAKGKSVNIKFDTPYFTSPSFGEHPSLDMAACMDDDYLNVFVLNKDSEKNIELDFGLYGFEKKPVIEEHIQYSSPDPYKTNKIGSDDNISPVVRKSFDEDTVGLSVLPYSWNVIRLKI